MNTTPAPWPQPIQHQVDPRQQRRIHPADIVATALLGVLQLAASAFVFLMAAMSQMVTDSCFENCRQMEADAMLAMLVTWGFVAAGVIVALIGIVCAARKRSPLWIWPAFGILVLILGAAAGLALLPDA